MDIRKRESRFASVGYLLGSGYLWLARDLNGSIAAYSHKPFKLDDECWRVEEGESKGMWMWVDDGDLYNFVKWEDDEPVNIREWLEKEEEEMKMYSVKDGELQCKEVDADFFKKNTTLVGLLSSDEIDMASCDDLTVTPLLRFPYLTSNMMATDGQDYDETESIGEQQIEMFRKLNNADSVQIMADNQIFMETQPRKLTFEDLDNVKIHEDICKELTETYKKKNADYGNSFENSLDKHGLIAGIVRMDDKMSRLISLNSKNKQLVLDESLRDTLMDLANYAIMSVMWLDEQ